jgi:ABC-type polysaccharide/polyol phosphate transport system ATPase subunit
VTEPALTVQRQAVSSFLPAVEVDAVSASYRVRLDAVSLRESVRRLVKRTDSRRLVPALRDVSFTVQRGTVMAIIGRNGAGKSTLLRTIAGILAPDAGRIVVRGRISTLLRVGVGFSDALTGRENIRLGGLAAGLGEERIRDLSGSIAEFAQLDEYLDFPIRTYSAGMRARLGFAVAAHLDPEVLLIDEALTGGDAAFQVRVADKMAEMNAQGRTVILVSHGLSSVRLMATDAIWLHQGSVAEWGDPDDVVSRYMRYCRLEELDLGTDDQ